MPVTANKPAGKPANRLGGKFTTEDLRAIIRALGFVQLDSIQIVARAHHHILWSRNPHYREPMLDQLPSEQAVFEHFTHDASILPIETYPYWRRQFVRMESKISASGWCKNMSSKGDIRKILQRIEKQGPVCSRDFTGKADRSVHAWMRPPHKMALDYLWYKGDLATARRENFVKYYDLAERVIPADIRAVRRSAQAQINWLCGAAMARLGVARARDIQRFWDAVSLEEARQWMAKTRPALIPVNVTASDGTTMAMMAGGDIEAVLGVLKPPTARMRILSPFDPAVRDRGRLERLFGFSYRIEIFVPAAKRQYGYYVYPVLEGDRFVGRIEIKVDRKAGLLRVENIWWESGVADTAKRQQKLAAELKRLARFVGARLVGARPYKSRA